MLQPEFFDVNARPVNALRQDFALYSPIILSLHDNAQNEDRPNVSDSVRWLSAESQSVNFMLDDRRLCLKFRKSATLFKSSKSKLDQVANHLAGRMANMLLVD